MAEKGRSILDGVGSSARPSPARGTLLPGPRRSGGSEGFSLIELMIIIIISSVLITVGLPFSRSFIANYRIRSAASGIVADLHLAKMASVRKNVNSVAVFNSAAYNPDGRAGDYYVFFDADGDWVKDAGEDTVVPTKTMPAGTSLYFSSFTNPGTGSTNRAGFGPSGLVARSTTGAFVSGEVRLRNVAGRYVRVQVSPAGVITMTKSQDGVNWN